MKKETLCVHSGTYRDDITGGINTPIFTSSATSYLDREKATYPRYFNTPNQEAVVGKLCALEGAEAGVLFSSGMAAMSTAILAFAKAGDHVVLMDELYGGTHSFATDDFMRPGHQPLLCCNGCRGRVPGSHQRYPGDGHRIAHQPLAQSS